MAHQKNVSDEELGAASRAKHVVQAMVKKYKRMFVFFMQSW
jgi:hypothetical protein